MSMNVVINGIDIPQLGTAATDRVMQGETYINFFKDREKYERALWLLLQAYIDNYYHSDIDKVAKLLKRVVEFNDEYVQAWMADLSEAKSPDDFLDHALKMSMKVMSLGELPYITKQ